jgi:hypothetical protein
VLGIDSGRFTSYWEAILPIGRARSALGYGSAKRARSPVVGSGKLPFELAADGEGSGPARIGADGA